MVRTIRRSKVRQLRCQCSGAVVEIGAARASEEHTFAGALHIEQGNLISFGRAAAVLVRLEGLEFRFFAVGLGKR